MTPHPNNAIMILHSVLNSWALFWNVVVIWLVIKKTPREIKTYSILILNAAIFDIIACVCDFMCQQRIISHNPSVMYISNGPCTMVSARFCFIFYNILLHCYSHNLWIVFLSYVYRYFVLLKGPFSTQRLLVVLGICYSFSFIQMVLLFFGCDEGQEVINKIQERIPYENLTEIPKSAFYGFLNIYNWKVGFFVFHATVPITPIVITIIYLRNKILSVLNETCSALSPSSKVINSQLMRALTFQSVVPLLFFYSIMSFFLPFSGIYDHTFLQYSKYVVFDIMPAASPIINIYFIVPYRRYLISVFTGKKVAQTSTTNPSMSITTADNRTINTAQLMA